MKDTPLGYKPITDRQEIHTGDELAVWNPAENVWDILTYGVEENKKSGISTDYTRERNKKKRITENLDSEIAQNRVYKKTIRK